MIARQGENNIVLLSAHIVSDVEQIADKILMMKEGELIFEGPDREQEVIWKLYLEKFGEVKAVSDFKEGSWEYEYLKLFRRKII